jgi:hypothetical protein
VNSITHDRFGKKWSNLDDKTVKAINRSIDNPTHISNRVQKEATKNNKTITGYNNPFDILNLGRHSGHRQQGHDIVSSMYTGFMIAGVEGARVGLVHYLMDGLSDNIKNQYGGRRGHGARFRDLWEAGLNYNAID